jgi:hypothetical protein
LSSAAVSTIYCRATVAWATGALVDLDGVSLVSKNAACMAMLKRAPANGADSTIELTSPSVRAYLNAHDDVVVAETSN